MNCNATTELAATETCKNDVKDKIVDDFTGDEIEDLANEGGKIGDLVKTEEKSDQESLDPVYEKTFFSEMNESSGNFAGDKTIESEDEMSKIQKLEKEMSELKSSLEDSQSQDGIVPLLPPSRRL